MKVKTVWGIVLIVLGIMGVFNGLQQYADIQAVDQWVGDFTRSFGQSNPRSYRIAMQDAQVGAFIKFLGGIGLAVLGTYWVKDGASEQQGQVGDHGNWEISQDHDDWKI